MIIDSLPIVHLFNYRLRLPPLSSCAIMRRLSEERIPLIFDSTSNMECVWDSKGQVCTSKIFVEIGGGFETEHGWSCYRRNYITIKSSFILEPASLDSTYYVPQHGVALKVQSFAMAIKAFSDVHGKPIDLIQFTAKRKKLHNPGPIKVEPRYSPPHVLSSRLSSREDDQETKHAAFDRIQFQKATGKGRGHKPTQRYFFITVELLADVEHEQRTVIASTTSPRLIVRGLSPSKYPQLSTYLSLRSVDSGHFPAAFTNMCSERSTGGSSHQQIQNLPVDFSCKACCRLPCSCSQNKLPSIAAPALSSTYCFGDGLYFDDYRRWILWSRLLFSLFSDA